MKRGAPSNATLDCAHGAPGPQTTARSVLRRAVARFPTTGVGLSGLAVATVLACDPPRGSAPPVAVVVRVHDAAGEAVAGAEIFAGTNRIARSDDAGLARLDVNGREGETFDLGIHCPAGYRSPAAPLQVRRLAIVGTTSPPEYAAVCARTRHQMVIAVRATGGPNLPVLYLGKEVARTDDAGAAHVAIDMDVDDRVELTLDTSGSGNEKLHPQNPSAVFEMHDDDDVQIFAATFTRDRKKQETRPSAHGPVQF